MRRKVGRVAVFFGCAALSLSIIVGITSGVGYWATLLRAVEAGAVFAGLGCLFGLLLAR